MVRREAKNRCKVPDLKFLGDLIDVNVLSFAHRQVLGMINNTLVIITSSFDNCNAQKGVAP